MVFNMYFVTLLLLLAYSNAAPENLAEQKKSTLVVRQEKETNDLKTASSSYSHQYSNWGGSSPGGYGFSITGFGTIDDNKYNFDPSYNAIGGYDDSVKQTGFDKSGYKGVTGYGSNLEFGGYTGDSGFSQTGAYGSAGYGASGYGPNRIGTSGYGPTNIGSSSFGDGGGYASIGGFGPGNGGYGGYGGNGGLNSYYGYNNPSYQGGGHLGYGYYNKKFGQGNIYGSGITPSLVTGYRGYTRR